MPIERYQPQGVSVGEVSVGSGYREEIGSIGDLVGVVDNLGNTAIQIAAQRAKVQGQLAGARDAIQRDDKGNLLPLTNLPAADTIYGAAYRDAAVANYGIAAQVDAQNMADQLGREHEMDPEAFRQSWNAYQQKTLAAMDKDVSPLLEPYYVRIGGDRFGKLADAQALRERAAAVDNITNLVEAKIRDASDQAYALRPTDGGIERVGQIVMAEIKPLLDQRLGIDPSFNKAKEEEALRAIQATMVGQGLLGEAWDVANSHKRVIDGIAYPDTDAAKKWLDNLVEHGGELAHLMNADELKAFIGRAHQWVEMKSAESEQQRSQQREAMAVAAEKNMGDWAQRIDNAPPEELEKLARDVMAPTTRFSGSALSSERIRNQLANQLRGKITTVRAIETGGAVARMIDQAGDDRELERAIATISDPRWRPTNDAATNETMKTKLLAAAEARKTLLDKLQSAGVVAEAIDKAANLDDLGKVRDIIASPDYHPTDDEAENRAMRNNALNAIRAKQATLEALASAQKVSEAIDFAPDQSTLANIYKVVVDPSWRGSSNAVKSATLQNSLLESIRNRRAQMDAAWAKDAPARAALAFATNQHTSLPQNATGEKAAEMSMDAAIKGGATFDPRKAEGEAALTGHLTDYGVLPQAWKDRYSAFAQSPSSNNLDFVIPMARAISRAGDSNQAAWSNLSSGDQQFYKELALQDRYNPGAPGKALEATLASLHRLRDVSGYQRRYDEAKAVVDDPTQQRLLERDMSYMVAGPTSLWSQIWRDIRGDEPPPETALLSPEQANRSIADILFTGSNDLSLTGLPRMPAPMSDTFNHLFVTNYARYGDRTVALKEATKDLAAQWGLSRTVEGGGLGWTPYPPERLTGQTHDAIMAETVAILDQNWTKLPSLSSVGKPDFAALADAGKVWLEPDYRAFDRGKIGWEIHWRGDDGVPSSYVLPNATFVPSGSTPLSPEQEARRIQAQKDVAGVPTVIGRQGLGFLREKELGVEGWVGGIPKRVDQWWMMNNPLGTPSDIGPND